MKGDWLLFALISVLSAVHVTGETLEQFLTLTISQKLALDKFKDRVLGKLALTHEYMKQDIHLIRWLRAADYNVDKAERMLKINLQWRKTHKVDSILEEDWTDFQERFPYYLGTHAKNKEPILAANIGEWDIRSVAIAGQMPRMIRYQVRLAEEALKILLKEMAEGKNVTRFHLLINMDGYNLAQQGCPQCLPFYVGIVTQYEEYYPNYGNNIILVNTPPLFEVILSGLRPLMHPITRKSLKVYGLNRQMWSKALQNFADKSQLLPEFGGTFTHSKAQ